MRVLRAVLLVALAWQLAANDTAVTLGAGGLVPVKSAEIAMESEDLRISIHQISIRYVFRNKTNRDVDVMVAFPLPPLNGGDLENEPMRLPSKDPVNYMDFHVSVDGKPVQPSVDVRSTFEGKDITTRLAALGLPVSAADKGFNAALAKLTKAQRDQLQKDNWIDCYDQQQHQCGAYWMTNIQYHWMQHFPAAQTVVVEHTYRPVVGGSYITRDDNGTEHIKPYCGGKTALAQIAELKKQHPVKDSGGIVLLDHTIQYILTTANNWSGPIGTFHLTITTDNADDIVLTCMPGVTRTAPARYEFTQTNFRPAKDLDLLILTVGSRFP